jgi:hypothetical protein
MTAPFEKNVKGFKKEALQIKNYNRKQGISFPVVKTPAREKINEILATINQVSFGMRG